MALSRIRGFFAVLKLRNYGIYTAGNAISLVGTWVQRIAVGWLTWELTGSGAWLGVMAFADLAPAAFIGPIAGAIADRTDRLRLTRISQALALALSALLFLLSAAGWIGIWSLFAVTLASGVVQAVNQPARLALISMLVPRTHLPQAVAMNSVVFNIARFVGPAIAGVAIATSGVALAFALNAASFLAFLIALGRIRIVQDEALSMRSASLLSDLRAGFRHALDDKGLSAMFALMIVTCVFARPMVELLPGFADAVFGAGATGLAILTSAIGAGAIVAGVWLGGSTDPARIPRTVVLAAMALGVALLLFTATRNFAVATVAMGICGVAMAATGIGSQTIIHLAVAPSMRGRILSMHGMVFRAGPSLGALAMGFASEFAGLRLPLAVGAAVVVLFAVRMWLRIEDVARALTSGWNERK